MRILLVDDHALFREGIKLLLKELDHRIEADEADNCEQALTHASSRDYDLVLLDLKMPGVQNLEALKRFRESHPGLPLVVLSGEGTPAQVREAIQLGCMGYIPKSSSHEIFSQALKLVLAGGVYLPPSILEPNVHEKEQEDATSANRRIENLSRRQIDVLRCVIQGKPNKVIARELDVSEHTVKAHLSAVFRALRVHNRTEAVYEAAKLGITLN